MPFCAFKYCKKQNKRGHTTNKTAKIINTTKPASIVLVVLFVAVAVAVALIGIASDKTTPAGTDTILPAGRPFAASSRFSAASVNEPCMRYMDRNELVLTTVTTLTYPASKRRDDPAIEVIESMTTLFS